MIHLISLIINFVFILVWNNKFATRAWFDTDHPKFIRSLHLVKVWSIKRSIWWWIHVCILRSIVSGHCGSKQLWRLMTARAFNQSNSCFPKVSFFGWQLLKCFRKCLFRVKLQFHIYSRWNFLIIWFEERLIWRALLSNNTLKHCLLSCTVW